MIGRIFIGYDPKEDVAYRVAEHSLRKHSSIPLVVTPIFLDRVRTAMLLWRRFEQRDGIAWDVLSKAPMSTEFALSRFLVPILAHSGWSLFIDPDVLVTRDIAELFSFADDRYAVMCVQHPAIDDGSIKMDGQVQTHYERKNWSSVVLYNSDHPGNRRLTLGVLNNTPGRQLHGFRWLNDEEIGELPSEWNHLIDIDSVTKQTPAMLHFTRGTPDVPGYENCSYAELWRSYANEAKTR